MQYKLYLGALASVAFASAHGQVAHKISDLSNSNNYNFTVTNTDLVTVTSCDDVACATVVCEECETPVECDGQPCSTLTQVETATTTVCDEDCTMTAAPACEYGPCVDMPSNYTSSQQDNDMDSTITFVTTVTVCEEESCTTSVMTTTGNPAGETTEMPTYRPTEEPSSSVKPTQVNPSENPSTFTGSASIHFAELGAVALALFAFFL